MSRIHVTIDKLVLRGIEPGKQKALVEGLQSELAKVLSNPASRAQWARAHRTPAMKLGQMRLESGASGGRKFGTGMAQAIGRRLMP